MMRQSKTLLCLLVIVLLVSSVPAFVSTLQPSDQDGLEWYIDAGERYVAPLLETQDGLEWYIDAGERYSAPLLKAEWENPDTEAPIINVDVRISHELSGVAENLTYVSLEKGVEPVDGDTPNIVLISIDGLSRARFEEFLGTSRLKTLSVLIEKGWSKLDLINIAYYTQTLNGHATMLTGYMGKVTGVYGNLQVYNPTPPGYTMLERLADNYTTAFITRKYKNIYPAFNESVYEALDYVFIKESQPEGTADQCIRFLKQCNGSFFAFFHFREPDKSGHIYKEGSDEWEDAVVDVDRQVGRVLEYSRSAGLYNDTLFIITTDHGFTPIGDAHKHEPEIWLLTNIPEVAPSMEPLRDLRDIAPTIYQAISYNYSALSPAIEGVPLQRLLTLEELQQRNETYTASSPSVFPARQTVETKRPMFNTSVSVVGYAVNLFVLEYDGNANGRPVYKMIQSRDLDSSLERQDVVLTLLSGWKGGSRGYFIIAYNEREIPSGFAYVEVERQ
jgi:hypothetical protein